MAILTREQLKQLSIHIDKASLMHNEASVAWKDSILGKSSKGITNVFSWLGNAVKKNLQKRKINGLVMQWGLEYVKALQAFDTGAEVENKFVNTDEEEVDNIEASKVKLEGELLDSFNSLYKLFSQLNDESKEFRKHFDKNTMINLNAVQTYVDTVLDSVSWDVPVFEKMLKSLLEKFPNDKALQVFDVISKVLIELGEGINEDSDLYQRLQPLFPSILAKYIPAEGKLPEQKKKMGTLVNTSVETLFNYLSSVKRQIEVKQVEEPKPEELKVVEEPKTEKLEVNAFSLINEANEFKLPDNVTELFPAEDLKKFEAIQGIKEKTFSKINIKALDTIMYEANFSIAKAKSNKNTEENSMELQRLWDLGVKNINNYFQNVIDTNKVMRSVRTEEVPDSIKKSVESTANAIDMIAQLGLTQLSPTNANFKDKELYALNVNILGQNGKKINNAFILLSPLAEFKEAGTDANYFWFKIFGQYTINEKGAIQRLNPFKGLTNNSSLIKNFEAVENSYIVCFESLKVSNKLNRMWTYSNKGSLFYDGKIFGNTTEVVQDIKRFNITEWMKVGNVFRYYVNSRLEAGKLNVNRFPGIQSSDLVNEKSVDVAKKNHDDIINNLRK